jgi:hypothetical protein
MGKSVRQFLVLLVAVHAPELLCKQEQPCVEIIGVHGHLSTARETGGDTDSFGTRVPFIKVVGHEGR